jgi:hypothetical protein
MSSTEANQMQMPSFAESPLGFLQACAQCPSSPEVLALLASATVVFLPDAASTSDLAALYLYAAARHLPSSVPEHKAAAARTRTFREAESAQQVAVILTVRVYDYWD